MSSQVKSLFLFMKRDTQVNVMMLIEKTLNIDAFTHVRKENSCVL
jgi:hypothetical protein